jgi:hypothetical protein
MAVVATDAVEDRARWREAAATDAAVVQLLAALLTPRLRL